MEGQEYLNNVESAMPHIDKFLEVNFPHGIYPKLKRDLAKGDEKSVKFWFDRIVYYLPDRYSEPDVLLPEAVKTIFRIRALDVEQYPNKPTSRLG